MEMNPESQTPLDQVQEFVHLLNEAVKYGYDISFDEKSWFSFSPVDILLDSLIDILLVMRKLFDFGSQGPKKNIGLGFSDKYQDVLGNPKQFRISHPRDYYWDPNASEYLMQLASTFVLIKNKDTFKNAFMAFFEALSFKPRPNNKTKKTRKSRANYHYWRRRRKL